MLEKTVRCHGGEDSLCETIESILEQHDMDTMVEFDDLDRRLRLVEERLEEILLSRRMPEPED